MPAPPPHPMDGMGFGDDGLLDMSPSGAVLPVGTQEPPPRGSLATPVANGIGWARSQNRGAGHVDLSRNGHPARGLPMGTFDNHVCSIQARTGGAPRLQTDDRVTATKRQSRSLRHCPHASCTYSTDQGAVRLATHVKTHLHDRPHQCEQCGKPFKTTEHLRQHARTHIELRLFTCDRPVCKHTDHPAFKTSIELALHAKRTHTLDKAEAREVRLLLRVDKMQTELKKSTEECDTLRAAVDVLTKALKDVSGGRKGKGCGRKEEEVGVAGTGTARREEETNEVAGAGENDPSSGPPAKKKKPYTLSAVNVLRVAERTVQVACVAVQRQGQKGKRKGGDT